jgi:hypothetical protein
VPDDDTGPVLLVPDEEVQMPLETKPEENSLAS